VQRNRLLFPVGKIRRQGMQFLHSSPEGLDYL
jgi:hypothetical protein